MLRYYFRASGDNARCVKTDIPCAVCGRAAPNGGSARITCRKSAAAYVLPDAVNVIVCARDIADLIPVVCARVTVLPTVPGRQEAPESTNKSRWFSGCPGVPGTARVREAESTTSRARRIFLDRAVLASQTASKALFIIPVQFPRKETLSACLEAAQYMIRRRDTKGG